VFNVAPNGAERRSAKPLKPASASSRRPSGSRAARRDASSPSEPMLPARLEPRYFSFFTLPPLLTDDSCQIAVLLETISLNLSSPPLSPDILRVSKAYLFLIPSTTSAARETIVGCVVTQRIDSAMAIARPGHGKQNDADGAPLTATLVVVDTDSGLFCDPRPLPTPLGIPRLFVPSAHRRQGIATRLLDAAAATFIHGCELSARLGDVAFTQPTSLGQAVMDKWGAGNVRIYHE